MNNYIFPFLWMRGEDEATIRTEIEKIYECGIRAVCVEARPHDDFCGPGWWHDMDIVIDEAKKRDMKIWILDDKHFPTGYANGLIAEKYPERKKQYIGCTTADLYNASGIKTLNVQRMMKPTIGFWQIGDPVNYEERAKNRLVSLVALRVEEGRTFYEDGVDLTDKYDPETGMATFELPDGVWSVHCVYWTRTDGGDETYINMIDAESAATQIEGVYESHFEHYGDLFGTVIAGFFSDEPQLGNNHNQTNDTKLGKIKERIPWSRELEEGLTARWGEQLGSVLPFLFTDSAEKENEVQIRYDYMDLVSRLYAKNFARPIGEWCHAHGVEYIGHVVEDNSVHSRLGLGDAHWFRAMEGQDMAGIDIIGGQYYPGAMDMTHSQMVDSDGEFYQYTIGKLGASAGHLDPKKKGRTMCELFGAYGWSFGVRDMKYLLDHLLSQGVNHLVPHAFSMAAYPDIDCPPHFYAHGKNAEFPYFAELMKYANRMCDLLNGGQHEAKIAVLYDGEADWCGERMSMQKVLRQLSEHQIECDIISLDMLRDPEAYQGSLTEDAITLNGIRFEAVVVPSAEYLPADLVAIMQKTPSVPFLFADAAPLKFIRGELKVEKEVVTLPANGLIVRADNLAEGLRDNGYAKSLLTPAAKHISLYQYRKEIPIYMLFNESMEEAYEGTVLVPASNRVEFYNGFSDTYERAEAEFKNGEACVKLQLAPGESCVLVMDRAGSETEVLHQSYREQLDGCERMNLSGDWKVSCAEANDHLTFGEATEEKTLAPFSEAHPKFSGVIRYEKQVAVAEAPKEAYLRAEKVGEVMTVFVNGEMAGRALNPPYQVSVGGALRSGENTVVIEVATTPARDQLNYPMAPFDFSHEALEATGLYGEVSLYLKK